MQAIELLSPNRVLVDLKVSTRTQLFKRLAELMCEEQSDVDVKTLEASLNLREKLGSTALGGGLALPHGRLPALKQPIGAFVRLAKPLNFGANSPDAVDLIFAFATPTVFVEPQLKLLAQVAQMFDDITCVTQLRAAQGSRSLFETLNAWFLKMQG
jgi:nitrogen PTS system EIIA component